MSEKIETLIKKITLRDVEMRLLDAKLEGMIIPDEVFTIIKNLEDSYE